MVEKVDGSLSRGVAVSADQGLGVVQPLGGADGGPRGAGEGLSNLSGHTGHPLMTKTTPLPERVAWEQVDFTTPRTWRQFYGRRIGRTVIGMTLAFSTRSIAFGFEIVNGDAKGLAILFGPFLICLAILRAKETP